MRIFRRGPEVRTPDESPLRAARVSGGSGSGVADVGFEEAAAAITFADVAGLEPVVSELRDIVGYLADPAGYEALGARPPKGVLLFGEPGCGKTMLGRAVAGEVGVPFYFVSATSFVERFVGLGASRVRELFNTAGADAPCIVFIDEIDAVGRHRSEASGEREFDHTLNQLLVELDGFLSARGVVIMAATNRPDLLDPALVRPGRFDRRIEVPRPDASGRLAVLKLYADERPCASDVDWADVAEVTEGRPAADLATLVNEASLLAVRRRATEIAWQDVELAVDRLTRGAAGAALTADADLDRLAQHEAGHALVAVRSPSSRPLARVSLAVRISGVDGPSAWSTVHRHPLCTSDELLAELAVLMGGRAAERILAGDPSTLAEDDLGDARRLAERMERLGLGDVDELLDRSDREAMALVEQEHDVVEAVGKALRAAGSLPMAEVRGML